MKRLAKIPTSGTYPLGFKVGASHCGIKKNPQALDLAAIVSDRECNAAAVFTTNLFKAAPVQVDQTVLNTTNGHNIRSLVINSGCANAVTGMQGLADAKAMIDASDKALGITKTPASLCMSTGVIGQLLPLQKVTDGIAGLLSSGIHAGHSAWLSFAKGIMTTDTFPKLVSTQFKVDDRTYNLAGVSKGAGMICPNMATLLGCLATDAPVSPIALQMALKKAVDTSFNSISIDGDMSTNDTIVALANGAAGGVEIDIDTPHFDTLVAAFGSLATELAQLVVRDGEGATKFVTINVSGAESDSGAKTVASAIGNSMLVKTALYGKDANWGRILCAIGYSGATVNPKRTDVTFVPTDGSAPMPLLVGGEPETVDESRASEILELPDLQIDINLGVGDGQATLWTTDLSHEYVTINGDYRS